MYQSNSFEALGEIPEDESIIFSGSPKVQKKKPVFVTKHNGCWGDSTVEAIVSFSAIIETQQRELHHRLEKDNFSKKSRSEEENLCKRETCKNKDPHPFSDCKWKSKETCEKCGVIGHVSEECFKNYCSICEKIVKHKPSQCIVRCTHPRCATLPLHPWKTCKRNSECSLCQKKGHLVSECYKACKQINCKRSDPHMERHCRGH